MDDQRWPETQPIIWQNEERRRSKQIRKEYFKVIHGVGNYFVFFFFYLVLLGLFLLCFASHARLERTFQSICFKAPCYRQIAQSPIQSIWLQVEGFHFQSKENVLCLSLQRGYKGYTCILVLTACLLCIDFAAAVSIIGH